MKVLNVAQNSGAAEKISSFLSDGSQICREGVSKYKKVYEFDCTLLGQECEMIMTSVSGHLLQYNFISPYNKNWGSCSPEDLFDKQVVKSCPENLLNIKKTLEREVRGCEALIIWTNFDREGENIGFEIIDTCKAVKPDLKVYRAKLSEITAASIEWALQNLGSPNKLASDAVDVRRQLDLRIGAVFTRWQTLLLQKISPGLDVLSYGSCQFPTFGFVARRYLERDNFISQDLWEIKMSHTINDLTMEYKCHPDQYNRVECLSRLARCTSATVTKIDMDEEPKFKSRPAPLNTTEMEKIASKKLGISAKETSKIAEKLYTEGYISYPRTETNIFPPSLNLGSLVEMQASDPRWRDFASRILSNGLNPSQGESSDRSHPPIHPIKYTSSLEGNKALVYEFIVRHFLACVSKDAKGHETKVTAEISGEKFVTSGLIFDELNYLEVYQKYENSSNAIYPYTVDETFQPTALNIVKVSSQPDLLTEFDLISLMEQHKIGTDHTRAQHIETIISRRYARIENKKYFVPSNVGLGLFDGYKSMGLEREMIDPTWRASLEEDLRKISEGSMRPEEVLKKHIAKYKEVFMKAKGRERELSDAMDKRMKTQIQS